MKTPEQERIAELEAQLRLSLDGWIEVCKEVDGLETKLKNALEIGRREGADYILKLLNDSNSGVWNPELEDILREMLTDAGILKDESGGKE